MANDILSSDFHFYQSANAEDEQVKANFLVRLNEFDVIMDDIRRQPAKGSVQHFLLIGRRGSGKSTLLKRIQIELESTELSQKFIAVNLAEEQANVYKLYDLLEAVLEELEYHAVEVDIPACEVDTDAYTRKLFAAMHNALTASGKKLVLLLDNIDRIFENMQAEASLFREYLLNYSDLKIIGGSTRMSEHFWKYNKPFYEFFRVLELKPLTSDEIKRLLLSWSEKLNLPALAEFVSNKAGQLETVRILTDGLPRTLQFFVNILLNRTQETGYEYLRLIMDSVTPLYQERLNSLPPSQRKIVLQLAFLWEGVGAKEISEVTKMDTRIISAQLKQLIEKGIAEKIETNTKNHLYRLSERFFNLWLIFTQGSPKEKRKARGLTIFLENFYDAEEIVRLAAEHLKLLKEGSPTGNKAALITKALSQSKYIKSHIRDELINTTLKLENISGELLHQLPFTTEQIKKDIDAAVDNEDYLKAIKLAESIEHEDGYREMLLGYINEEQGQKDKATEYYEKALKKEQWLAAHSLALLNFSKNPNSAETYFKTAMEHQINASFHLAALYYVHNRNKDKVDELLNLHKSASKQYDIDIAFFEVIFDVWRGKLDNLEARAVEVLSKKEWAISGEVFVICLLIHGQVNLVSKLFANPVFGAELKETFLPLFYAAAILREQRNKNTELKIPPELKETVDIILRNIHDDSLIYE
jgi:hypothetical protein